MSYQMKKCTEQEFRKSNPIGYLKMKNRRMRKLLQAARHLILAAQGPTGGPTNWNDTRDNWLNLLDREIKENLGQEKEKARPCKEAGQT